MFLPTWLTAGRRRLFQLSVYSDDDKATAKPIKLSLAMNAAAACLKTGDRCDFLSSLCFFPPRDSKFHLVVVAADTEDWWRDVVSALPPSAVLLPPLLYKAHNQQHLPNSWAGSVSQAILSLLKCAGGISLLGRSYVVFVVVAAAVDPWYSGEAIKHCDKALEVLTDDEADKANMIKTLFRKGQVRYTAFRSLALALSCSLCAPLARSGTHCCS